MIGNVDMGTIEDLQAAVDQAPIHTVTQATRNIDAEAAIRQQAIDRSASMHTGATSTLMDLQRAELLATIDRHNTYIANEARNLEMLKAGFIRTYDEQEAALKAQFANIMAQAERSSAAAAAKHRAMIADAERAIAAIERVQDGLMAGGSNA